jgi:hypothetical protein
MPSIFLESFSASFDILGQKKNKTFGIPRGVENNKIVLTLQIIFKSSWNLQNRVPGLILHPLVYSIFHVDGLEKNFDTLLWPRRNLEPDIVHNYWSDIYAYNKLI